MHAAQSIEAPAYGAGHTEEDDIITRALDILTARIKQGPAMNSPDTVRQYLTVKASKHEAREVFGVMFLDSQNCLIEYREMFFGTLNQTSVYPREVARAALELKAAACILSHNHPSRADEMLTTTLKTALALVDVRVLDHVITGGGKSVSMAERGLI